MGIGFWAGIAVVIVLTLLTAWGIMNEARVAAWERRTWARFRRWYKKRQIEWISAKLTDAGLTVVPVARTEIRERDAGCVALIEDFYRQK